ncbi:DUF1989 domain-containing protein [Yoonia sp.]|uniref:DUF1989 domain-containing protein n=1 Tax=Yoonia sp. TaxID=2212373 RepID=UPI0025DAAD0D|nr:DUF1989 domain-containing protein [Yoonia sp.]
MATWFMRDTPERMCLPDTVKLQWTTDLTKRRVIFSDICRVMLSIIEDSGGALDALSGGSTPDTVAQYGMPAMRKKRENMLQAAAHEFEIRLVHPAEADEMAIPSIWVFISTRSCTCRVIRPVASGFMNAAQVCCSGRMTSMTATDL